MLTRSELFIINLGMYFARGYSPTSASLDHRIVECLGIRGYLSRKYMQSLSSIQEARGARGLLHAPI